MDPASQRPPERNLPSFQSQQEFWECPRFLRFLQQKPQHKKALGRQRPGEVDFGTFWMLLLAGSSGKIIGCGKERESIKGNEVWGLLFIIFLIPLTHLDIEKRPSMYVYVNVDGLRGC